MLIRRRKGWEIKESEATPEAVYLARRDLLKGAAAGVMAAPAMATGIAAGLAAPGDAAAAVETDPSASLYPVKRNPKYTLDRPITSAKYSQHYNNYYEFGSQKSIAPEAQAIKLRPWTIRIDGLVEKPFTIGIDDLLKKMPLEERLYRHRCVEAWSMAVPWCGFQMSHLIDLAKPLSSAKYIRTETFKDPAVALGQREFWYPWPYIEGLSMPEARNELAFFVTGMYNKPVPKQDGAPLRFVVPWKYGFKSAKAIVRITFTDKQPMNFWQKVQGNEYGFWANVNPKVPHPRWSQATERVLGTDKRVPTQIWNGYGEYVAQMYAGLNVGGVGLFR